LFSIVCDMRIAQSSPIYF